MGQRIGKAFRDARQRLGKTQGALCDTACVGPASLSAYEKGSVDPPFDNLANLADAYDLPYRTVFQLWAEDQLKSQEPIDRLKGEILLADGAAPRGQFQAVVDSLAGNRGVHKAAKEVLKHLDAAKVRLDDGAKALLTALADIADLAVEGGNQSTTFSAERDQWVSLRKDVKTLCKKQRLFLATRPTPMLAEMHCFPPAVCGLHRQASLASRSQYHELWCVMKGSGILLVQQEGADGSLQWHDFEALPGRCGRYFGGYRHIWLNTSQIHPLVLFHVFYPYREWEEHDEGIEFKVHEAGQVLPADQSEQVNAMLRKHGAL